MGGMFHTARKFNKPLGKWDTSKVTKMSSMFHDATSFNQEICGWDISRVADMSLMFTGATSFIWGLAPMKRFF